jgi:lincosamide nucleotidyltransferase A/C/D/E
MKPEMTSGALIAILHLLENAGIEVWLDGGWAVDAALGIQTRPHQDVDIVLRVADLPLLIELLSAKGFKVQQGGTASNFVLADGAGLEVDVHAIEFNEDGSARFRMENGSDWIFPADGFKWNGVVQGTTVRCLSPETQVLCHSNGYVPQEKDLRDMELLQARFGLELPQHLKRASGRVIPCEPGGVPEPGV